MVEVLERTLDERVEIERKGRLFNIAREVCGIGRVQDFACISINPLFRTFTGRFKSAIFVHPDNNLITVKYEKYLPLALHVAEEYEKRGEGDFTLRQDY